MSEKKAEDAFSLSESAFREMFDASPEMISIQDITTGEFLYANAETERATGYPFEEFRKLGLEEFSPKSEEYSMEKAMEHMQKAVKGIPQSFEWGFIDRQGEFHHTEVKMVCAKIAGEDRLVSFVRDNTDKKIAEKRIEDSLKEKTVLLKENHHRVKNNLQIITSLLDLQSDTVENEDLTLLYKESQDRIKSMALIHEKLYQSEDLAKINMGDYITSLLEQIQDSYYLYNVDLETGVETDDFSIHLDTAIPCGLIINEIVSNSLKHAFSKEWIDEQTLGLDEGKFPVGKITVEMRKGRENELHLVVKDNGIGLPKEIDPETTDTLGMQLISMLIHQLNGTVEISKEQGTVFRIVFRPRSEEAVITNDQ